MSRNPVANRKSSPPLSLHRLGKGRLRQSFSPPLADISFLSGKLAKVILPGEGQGKRVIKIDHTGLV
jgi:hypothetical protein